MLPQNQQHYTQGRFSEAEVGFLDGRYVLGRDIMCAAADVDFGQVTYYHNWEMFVNMPRNT